MAETRELLRFWSRSSGYRDGENASLPSISWSFSRPVGQGARRSADKEVVRGCGDFSGSGPEAQSHLTARPYSWRLRLLLRGCRRGLALGPSLSGLGPARVGSISGVDPHVGHVRGSGGWCVGRNPLHPRRAWVRWRVERRIRKEWARRDRSRCPDCGRLVRYPELKRCRMGRINGRLQGHRRRLDDELEPIDRLGPY
jgi:hypothetical protein